MLAFVSRLADGARSARRTLDSFLRGKEAMLSVDEESMWALLTPRRRRWASDGPFITMETRNGGPPSTTGDDETMTTINEHLAAIEQHIQAMDKAAASGTSESKMREGWNILTKLAQKIKSPNQSQNATYYGLGAPVVDTVAAAPSGGEELTFDVYALNQELANDIIAKAEETSEAIDKAASKHGERFAATQARQDLHAVTSKVAGILNSTSLTEPWVGEDLKKLAARNDQIHALFFPKK